jgi:type IV pilus assembly protein PilO
MAAPPAQTTLAKLPPAVKFGIGGGLAALVALGYWVIFYSDINAKIATANVQAGKLKSDLASAQQENATYLADKEDLTMRQQRQHELNKALPAETEAAGFLSALQQAANVSGVELKTWSPQEEKVESFYGKFPMRLEMTGRFHQIAKFAYEVGRVERIINVENIEMGEPKVEGDEVVVKAKCLATTFHTLKNQPAKPGASAAPATGAPPGSGPVLPPGATK